MDLVSTDGPEGPETAERSRPISTTTRSSPRTRLRWGRRRRRRRRRTVVVGEVGGCARTSTSSPPSRRCGLGSTRSPRVGVTETIDPSLRVRTSKETQCVHI